MFEQNTDFYVLKLREIYQDMCNSRGKTHKH